MLPSTSCACSSGKEKSSVSVGAAPCFIFDHRGDGTRRRDQDLPPLSGFLRRNVLCNTCGSQHHGFCDIFACSVRGRQSWLLWQQAQRTEVTLWPKYMLALQTHS
ncbi:hypothetical protein Nmel_006880 [Mimus melanotis]